VSELVVLARHRRTPRNLEPLSVRPGWAAADGALVEVPADQLADRAEDLAVVHDRRGRQLAASSM
jgi:hypothetical protein